MKRCKCGNLNPDPHKEEAAARTLLTVGGVSVSSCITPSRSNFGTSCIVRNQLSAGGVSGNHWHNRRSSAAAHNSVGTILLNDASTVSAPILCSERSQLPRTSDSLLIHADSDAQLCDSIPWFQGHARSTRPHVDSPVRVANAARVYTTVRTGAAVL